jgi:hypothetical protein
VRCKHALELFWLFVIRQPLAKVLANIHSSMLVDCRQDVYGGEIGEDVESTARLSAIDRRKESAIRLSSSQNLPYSKLLLMDRIK